MLARLVSRVRPLAEAQYSFQTVTEDSQRGSYFPSTGVLFCGSVVGILIAKAKEGDNESTATALDIIPSCRLAEVDQLYDQNKHLEQLLEALLQLSEQYPKHDEILWRLARCYYEQGKKLQPKERLEKTKLAQKLVSAALVINEKNSSAHRWKAIMSNSQTEQEGMKAHILNLDTMRYHLERAVELNPHCGTSWTMLGIWYFGLVELTWYERKFANTCLGKIPNASYEQALQNLLKAEEMAPLNWNKNMMLIGKVYLRLRDHTNAKNYLERTLQLEVVTDEDVEVLAEAEELLKQC